MDVYVVLLLLSLHVLLIRASLATGVVDGENEMSPSINGPSELFEHMLILVEPNVYILFWSSNQSDITFEVHVKGSSMF